MAKKLFVDGQSTPIEGNQREASRRTPLAPKATPIALCAVPERGWTSRRKGAANVKISQKLKPNCLSALGLLVLNIAIVRIQRMMGDARQLAESEGAVLDMEINAGEPAILRSASDPAEAGGLLNQYRLARQPSCAFVPRRARKKNHDVRNAFRRFVATVS